MLYQRQTKQEKKERKQKLQDALNELEKTQEIKDYKYYLSLSYREREVLKTDWDRYFEKVKTTKAYKRFWKMRDIWNVGNNNEQIKEWSSRAAEQVKNGSFELPKPYGRDPVEYLKNDIYLKYEYIKGEITKLETREEKEAREAFN